jgi:hypothetical protein
MKPKIKLPPGRIPPASKQGGWRANWSIIQDMYRDAMDVLDTSLLPRVEKEAGLDAYFAAVDWWREHYFDAPTQGKQWDNRRKAHGKTV